MDKGLGSARRMKNFDDQGIFFVIRVKENRRYEEIKSFIEKDQEVNLEDSLLIKDSLVKIYSSTPVFTQKGKIYNKEQQIENKFRLIVVANKQQPQKEVWLLTNDFELSAKDIADYYDKFFSDIAKREGLSKKSLYYYGIMEDMYKELKKTNFIVDINNPEYMFENIVDDEYSQWNELLNKIISI